MRLMHIDPELRRVANAARQELEIKRLRVQLKRCKNGIPHNPKWEAHWEDYISSAVTQVVADYLARKNAAPQTQNKRPVAPVWQQPATQVAQFQNPAAQPYNRVAQQAPQAVQNRVVSKPAPGI